MPCYDYICKTCQHHVSIIRTMSESEVPPTQDEVGDSPCKGEAHDYEKRILGAPGVVKGWGWGAGKGNW